MSGIGPRTGAAERAYDSTGGVVPLPRIEVSDPEQIRLGTPTLELDFPVDGGALAGASTCGIVVVSHQRRRSSGDELKWALTERWRRAKTQW